MKQIRKRLTYANVMSSLAVFLILGGASAYAAVSKVGANEIKANSIKTGKIVKEAVTAGKIKTGAVTESRIADGAVATNKIAENAVTTNKIADNAVTTNKIANDAVTGDKVKESTLSIVPNASQLGGLAAANYIHTPIRQVEAISANTSAETQFREVTASCLPGERAIAGGAMWTMLDGSPTGFNFIQGSRPVPFGDGTGLITGWQATGITNNASPRQLRAYAICVPA